MSQSTNPKSDQVENKNTISEDKQNEQEIKTKEKTEMSPLMDEDSQKGLIVGDDYYLLNKTWWKQWKMYVGEDTMSTMSYYKNASRPGPIDNAPILEEDGVTVKRNLREDGDFILMNKKCWDKIHEWYGGGPVIARKCIQTGHANKRKFVEIRKLQVRVIYSKRPKTFQNAFFSKSTHVGDFINEMEKKLMFDRTKIRVFDFHNGNKLKALTDENALFDDIPIIENQYMLIEEQKKDGSWPKDKIYKKFSTRVSSYASRDPTPPGKTGLSNLGNTCFMNSALQCLCHTVPLVDFFLSGQYASDINRVNPLGMKGEMADEFADLMKELWSSQIAVSEPRTFLKALEKFAPRFSGYQQHDSQELLAFLLDGLHEDMNRVKEKPYVEKVEGGDGKNDSEVAIESWNSHLKRNKSIIVDLIQGQLKSTLTCPEDKKVSITFDPFMYLTVPIPTETLRKINVKVFFLQKDKLPVKYGVMVDKDGQVKDLKVSLGKLCAIEPERLVLVDMYKCRFHTQFTDKQDLSDIKLQDKVHAHEILLSDPIIKKINKEDVKSQEKDDKEKSEQEKETKQEKENEKEKETEKEKSEEKDSKADDDVEIVHCPVFYQKIGQKYSSLFGLPFIVSVPNTYTYKELYQHLLNRLSPVLKEQPTGDVNFDDSEGNQPIFSIKPVDSWGQSNGNEFAKEGKLKLKERQNISMDWTKENKKKYLDKEKIQKYEHHVSLKEELPDLTSKLNLNECLVLFNKEEQLGPNDTWYCSGCKTHQQAFKKFDIWTSPKILIVHLKRFSYKNRYREKIGTLIDFPLENLDMTKFIPSSGNSDISPLYDLYAVSNHYGGLGGGHYTAYCKHRDDGEWYCFDDSNVKKIIPNDVITDKAYVLFYKRKDVPWTPFNPAWDTKESENSNSDDSDEEEENDTQPAVIPPAGSDTQIPAAGTQLPSAGSEHPPAGREDYPPAGYEPQDAGADQPPAGS